MAFMALRRTINGALSVEYQTLVVGMLANQKGIVGPPIIILDFSMPQPWQDQHRQE